MRFTIFAMAALALISSSLPGRPASEEKKAMTVKKITPVLFAAEIEPCVKFWVERFGFERTMEVPDGNKLAFAIVQKGGVELMYQSFASADKDAPASTAQAIRKGPTFLYVEVENLDDTIGALKGAEVVMPVRTTFYGSREIGVTDPAGHYVTFAQMNAAPQK
jgi:uncharacterized glyoxalase superfamily protein PhnB